MRNPTGIHLPALALALLAFGAVSAGPATAAPPRLAVVGGETAGDLAALVLAELGKREDVALVERDDLAKIGDEVQLRQIAGTSPADLGRLLKADGLLFLNATPDGTEARFTAVRLGLALFDDRFASGADLPHLAELIARRVADAAPKLGLRPGEAIPVSVLNLRSRVADAQASGMERKLTLLLESELSALPSCVVLERRHASALKFENLLSGEALALLQGVSVIDGELGPPAEGSAAVEAALRVRTPGREPVSLKVAGSASDLPALAAAMAAAIGKTLGTAAPPAPWQARAEAREYLLEGVWGYQHDAIPAALEALDSAELLGESAPDLAAVRIPVLCAVAAGSSNVIRGDADVPDDPHPEARIEAISRAIDEAARYEKSAPQGDLQVLNRADLSLWNPGFLHGTVCRAASELLAMLDRTHSPRADDVRSALREFAGFDPRHGKVPRPLLFTVLRHADSWCDSMDEELALYRGLCAVKSDSNDWMATTDTLVPTEFCARFLPDPQRRPAALLDFARSLLADPATRPIGLLILARPAGSGGREEPSQVFFEELGARRDELAAQHQLNRFLAASFALERNIQVSEADPQLVALLRFGLQHADGVDGHLAQAWSPELFPVRDAPALWDDLETLAKKTPVNPVSSSAADRYLSAMRRRYIERFGNPAGAGANALAVSRFWQPDDAPASPRFASYPVAVAPDGLWLAVLHGNVPVDGTTLYHVTPGASFATETIPCPGLYPQEAAVTGKAVYLLGEPPGQFTQSVLARFDPSSRQWEKHAIPASRRIFAVGDQIYLSLSGRGREDMESGIARYDEAAGEAVILASSRRRPAQNQFDDRDIYSVQGIFAGPGNKPCAAIGFGETFCIEEQPGPWPRLIPSGMLDFLAKDGPRTLLYGRKLDPHDKSEVAFLIDPAKPEPELWLGHARTTAGDQDGRLPVAAPAAAFLVADARLALACRRGGHPGLCAPWRRYPRLGPRQGDRPIPAPPVPPGRGVPAADPPGFQDGRGRRSRPETKGRCRRRPRQTVPGAGIPEPANVRDRHGPVLLRSLERILVPALRGSRSVCQVLLPGAGQKG